MSRIIKSGNASGLSNVRPLAERVGTATVVSISKHDEEREDLLRRIAQLEERLTQRDGEAAYLRTEIERGREEGKEQGYESGLIAAEDRQSERLELLGKAMVRAHAALGESLQSVDRLAPLLAQDCLNIILGQVEDRADLVTDIVKDQLSKLDAAMLVSVRLSRLDFPDDALLAALANRLGITSVSLLACDDVASGGCTMTLRLGQMDVGLDQQWPVLRKALDEMAIGEARE